MQILNNGRTVNGSTRYSSSLGDSVVVIPTGAQHHAVVASLQYGATGQNGALERMLKNMSELILEVDPYILLYGRIKSCDSIFSKMLNNDHDVGQVLDIIGVRAITNLPHDCYRLICRIHSKWQVLAGEYDDYIAEPKPNGYRSIHTTVVSPCGFPVEIQVRTHTMHEICERGSAAHAVYKLDRVAWTSLLRSSTRLVGVA